MADRLENREKAAYLVGRILQGNYPEAKEWADRAALARMKEVLEAPSEMLMRIKDHALNLLAFTDREPSFFTPAEPMLSR